MKGRVLCLLLAALLLSTQDVDAQQVKLRLTLQGPITHPYYGVSVARFKDEVERQSGNAVSIQIFDKGQLFTDSQVVDAVSSGAVDIGIAASQLFAGRVPAAGILDQPFLFNFAALMRAAASPDSEIRKLIDEAILVNIGVRVLWWQSLGDSVFFSKGRDVADVERFRDQRVAVPGKTLEAFMARCGAKPLTLSVERFHDAIKDGKVDMLMLTPPGLVPWGFWKVTDTVTYTAHAPVEFIFMINDKAWQALSPSHRAIIAGAAQKVERESRDRLPELDAKTLAFATAKGMRFQQLTPDQVAEWRACSAELLAEYMEANGEIVHRLMAAYGKLRTDPCCSAGPSTAAFTRR
jgi:C4-dicarboxylate-binding protein DctP